MGGEWSPWSPSLWEEQHLGTAVEHCPTAHTSILAPPSRKAFRCREGNGKVAPQFLK